MLIILLRCLYFVWSNVFWRIILFLIKVYRYLEIVFINVYACYFSFVSRNTILITLNYLFIWNLLTQNLMLLDTESLVLMIEIPTIRLITVINLIIDSLIRCYTFLSLLTITTLLELRRIINTYIHMYYLKKLFCLMSILQENGQNII